MFNNQTLLAKVAASLLAFTCLAANSTQTSEILKPVPVDTAEITKAAQLNISQSIYALNLQTNKVEIELNTLLNTTAKKVKSTNTLTVKSELIAE